MLRRLFKGRHPLTHPDPAMRRTAVRDLSDAETRELTGELARLAREDPDAEVRRACLQRVDDRSVIETLVADPVLGAEAARRLEALSTAAAGGAANRPTTDLLSLPAAEAGARLEAVQDPDELVTLALKARGELRRLLLEHPVLGRADTLHRLEKRSRDKDKSLNRHARTRLEHFKQLAADADAHRRRARELAEALNRHPPAVQDRAWRERQHQLHERLHRTLDEYRELRAALAGFGDAPEDLEALRSAAADLPALEPEAAVATPGPESDPGPGGPVPGQPGEDPFETLVQGFRELDEALTAGGAFAELAGRRQALTDRWLTAADHQPPTEAQHAVFESVSHRFRELADAMERLEGSELPAAPAQPLAIGSPEDTAAHRVLWDAVAERRRLVKQLERIRRQVRWPDWAPPTTEFSTLLGALESHREELARADTVLQQELHKLEEQITELTAAIDEGSLNTAQSLLARSRALHDALPDAAARALGKRLGKEAARLAELKDWQTFATSPKREALVEAMETLAAGPLAPRAQADRIKALRRDWQALGPVTQAADGRLADRFNAAAERAFEPCRAYFAEQAERRKANLAERRRICDQLEQYLEETDWRQADMKGAEKIMRAARDEWRRFHPVDRNPGKSVEARFERLQGRLHDLVKAEWDRNLKAKEDIVAEAQALLEADAPVHDKVESAKRLQRRWRDVGITPRRPDQRLWREFRTACDHIFSARDESRHAADAAIDALQSRLEATMERLATELQGLDPASASAAALKTFRQETADIDRLPQSRRRPLAERRSELIGAYSELLDEQRRAARRGALLALARWDEAMTTAEVARRDGGDAADPEPPEGRPELLEARRAAAADEPPREAARRLAVKAELAAGLESPREDEPLRLEIQVERLQAGLSGAGGGSEEPDALVQAWCTLGPKDAGFAPWRERLFAALERLF